MTSLILGYGVAAYPILIVLRLVDSQRLCNDELGDPALYVIDVGVMKSSKVYQAIIKLFAIQLKSFGTVHIV